MRANRGWVSKEIKNKCSYENKFATIIWTLKSSGLTVWNRVKKVGISIIGL